MIFYFKAKNFLDIIAISEQDIAKKPNIIYKSLIDIKFRIIPTIEIEIVLVPTTAI